MASIDSNVICEVVTYRIALVDRFRFSIKTFDHAGSCERAKTINRETFWSLTMDLCRAGNHHEAITASPIHAADRESESLRVTS